MHPEVSAHAPSHLPASGIFALNKFASLRDITGSKKPSTWCDLTMQSLNIAVLWHLIQPSDEAVCLQIATTIAADAPLLVAVTADLQFLR
jgi:hypothetical protein